MKAREEKEIIKQILDRIELIEERLNRMLEETEEVQLIIDKEYIDRKNEERVKRW